MPMSVPPLVLYRTVVPSVIPVREGLFLSPLSGSRSRLLSHRHFEKQNKTEKNKTKYLNNLQNPEHDITV